MKLSTKSTYGVRAMFDLAIHSAKGPVSITSISKRQDISISYLEQLFNKLRRDGLVRSIRGPKGGYLLSRNPGDIKIGDIIRTLEGPIELAYCVSNEGGVTCEMAEACVTRLLWNKLKDSISEVLDSTTLKDLIDEKKYMCDKLPHLRS